MNIEYGAQHDTLNIEFLEGVEMDDSVESEGVVIDKAADGHIVSIEILDASRRTAPGLMDRVGFAVTRSE